MSVSHSAGPNAAVRKTGRFDKVHRFSAEIFVPFILSVTKKRITSCRRHDSIPRAEVRKARSRFGGGSEPDAGAPAFPCVPCGAKSTYRRASHDPCPLTCLLSAFTFLSAQPTRRPLSHTKPRRVPRRCDKAHGFSDGILAPFILSVIKKQITSCRRHEAISRAEARKTRRRLSGASEPGAGASASPAVEKALAVVPRTTHACSPVYFLLSPFCRRSRPARG